MDYCCEDFKITIEDYKDITKPGFFYRFTGHIIIYCPFCATKLVED